LTEKWNASMNDYFYSKPDPPVVTAHFSRNYNSLLAE